MAERRLGLDRGADSAIKSCGTPLAAGSYHPLPKSLPSPSVSDNFLESTKAHFWLLNPIFPAQM
jgi:hypothetical protein